MFQHSLTVPFGTVVRSRLRIMAKRKILVTSHSQMGFIRDVNNQFHLIVAIRSTKIVCTYRWCVLIERKISLENRSKKYQAQKYIFRNHFFRGVESWSRPNSDHLPSTTSSLILTYFTYTITHSNTLYRNSIHDEMWNTSANR